MLGRLIRVIRRGFGWWTGELASLLPAGLRQAAKRATPALVLDLGEQELLVHLCRGERAEELGRVALGRGDDASARRRLELLIPGILRGGAAVTLRLPLSDVLRKPISLPAAARGNLREVVGFSMDLKTPFKADEVRYDYRVIGGDDDGRQIRVDLAVAPRTRVDQALARLRDWGLRPAAVDVAEGPPSVRPRFNLLADAETHRPSRRGVRLAWLLTVLLCLLAAAALAVPLAEQQKTLAALEGDLAAAKRAAEAVRGLRDQVERLKQGSRFIIERKQRDLPAIAVLSEVTRLLPDDTWIFQLRQSGRRVQIYGYSASASGLIELIEASPVFAEVGFQAPVTRDPQSGVERFYLAFTLAGGAGQ